MEHKDSNMEAIETALLAGQRRITLGRIEVDLNPPLKHDTTKNKRKEARRRAEELMEIIRG